jgi:hypothetical protein
VLHLPAANPAELAGELASCKSGCVVVPPAPTPTSRPTHQQLHDLMKPSLATHALDPACRRRHLAARFSP